VRSRGRERGKKRKLVRLPCKRTRDYIHRKEGMREKEKSADREQLLSQGGERRKCFAMLQSAIKSFHSSGEKKKGEGGEEEGKDAFAVALGPLRSKRTPDPRHYQRNGKKTPHFVPKRNGTVEKEEEGTPFLPRREAGRPEIPVARTEQKKKKGHAAALQNPAANVRKGEERPVTFLLEDPPQPAPGQKKKGGKGKERGEKNGHLP